MSTPKILVIGAGPAGLSAAMALRQAGMDVTVLDAALRTGGKLGSDADAGGTLRDHGLHIFPAWYANLREIIATLGLSGALVDHEQVAYVARGEFPRGVRTIRTPSGAGSALHNTFRGPLPWWESMLYQYFMLDLAGQPLRRKSFLDRISETGLLYGRWYGSEGVARFIEANMLHAASVNASEISAMSWQQVLRYWLRTPSPFLSVLRGDLQTTLIEPWVAHLAAAGVVVTTDRRVTRLRVGAGGKLDGVTWASSGGATGTLAADAYVLAVPVEAARALVDDDVYAAAPELGDLNRLVSEPMSGYHVQLDRKIPDLGKDFLFLIGSAYGVSLIDVTPDAPTTTLSCVIGDFGPLRTLSTALVDELLLAEIRSYVPFPMAAIVRRDLHDNVSAPLFVNGIGSWPHRPRPRTRLTNLYMAGDYCRNSIDLACTEGAIYSGRHTAQEALRDLGYPAVKPKKPPTHPRLLYRAAWAFGAPLTAVPLLYRRFFAPRS